MLILLLLLYLHSSSCATNTQHSLSHAKHQREALNTKVGHFSRRDNVDVKVNVDVNTNNKTEAVKHVTKQNGEDKNGKPDAVLENVKIEDGPSKVGFNESQSTDKQNEKQLSLNKADVNQNVTTNETQQSFKADETFQTPRPEETQQNPSFGQMQQNIKPDETHQNTTLDQPQEILKTDETHQKENSDVMQQMLNKEETLEIVKADEADEHFKSDSTQQNFQIGATQQNMTSEDTQPNLKSIETLFNDNLAASNKVVKTDEINVNETTYDSDERKESFNDTRESDTSGESHQNYKHGDSLESLKGEEIEVSSKPAETQKISQSDQSHHNDKQEKTLAFTTKEKGKPISKLKKSHHKSKTRHSIRSTNKDVLEKILKNPKSKEHVTAVKILKALVKKLKDKNKAEFSKKVEQNISMKEHLQKSLELAANKDNTIAESAANITKYSVEAFDQNPGSDKNKLKIASPSKSQKGNHAKKKRKRKDKRKKSKKIRIILKKINKAIDMTAKNHKNHSNIFKNKEQKDMNTTLHGVYTDEINKTKEAFTEALKQAIKDTTTKTLLKLHQNLTETMHPNKNAPAQIYNTGDATLENNIQNQTNEPLNAEETFNTLNSTPSFNDASSPTPDGSSQDSEEPSNKTNSDDTKQPGLHPHTAHVEEEESVHNTSDVRPDENLDMDKNTSDIQKIKDRLKAEGSIGRPLTNASGGLEETNTASETGDTITEIETKSEEKDINEKYSNGKDKDSSHSNALNDVSKENLNNEWWNANRIANVLKGDRSKKKDQQKSNNELQEKIISNTLSKDESEENKEINSNNKVNNKSLSKDLPGKTIKTNMIKVTDSTVSNKNAVHPINHSNKVVTNTYKIIIHKNESKEFDTGHSDVLGDSRDPILQSFTKNSTENNNESGSGTNDEVNNPTEGGDTEEGDREIDFHNLNVNRNKPSSMTGKTLTITFQENALALGGSSKEEKEQVLPGTAHMKPKKPKDKHEVYEHTNQVTKYEDEEKRKPFKIKEAPEIQQKQYKIYEDNNKPDDANYTEGLLHDPGASKPQKLFNDSLFEMAGKTTNVEDQRQSNETQSKDNIAKTKLTLKDLENEPDDGNMNATLGDDFDEEAIDNSGGASGSSNIGEELFFSKNERLSDDVLTGDDNYGKYMQDKRDIIAQSFKKFASHILNSHPRQFLFMNDTNAKNKISDRRTSFKRYILDKIHNLIAQVPIFERPVKKSFNTTTTKRNELALQKRDGTRLQNTTFYDNAVNSDVYGSLFFKRNMKRNIVSEDDDDGDVDDQEQSTERYHKEMILEHQLMHETPDKIFQKSSFSNKPYRKRNEIPIVERIIAKRSAIGKELLRKNQKKNQMLQNKSLNNEKRIPKVKKSLDELKAIANKRIQIPLESTDDSDVTDDGYNGNEDSVDSLYQYGTDANIQSKPLFGSENDPFTQSLIAHSKPVGLQKDSMSLMDPPLIADSPSTPPDPTVSNSFSKEDETEAKQVLMSYKNSILDDTAGQDERKLLDSDGETNRVILDKEALQGIASDTAPMRPIENPLVSNDVENPTSMENQEDLPMHPPHGNMFSKMAQESVQAKEQSVRVQDQFEDAKTSFAEQKLHEMDMSRAGLELKARGQENEIHGSIRSSNSIGKNKSKSDNHTAENLTLQVIHFKNSRKKNPQSIKTKSKTELKHNESGMTKITSPPNKIGSLKAAVVKPLLKSKSKERKLASLGSNSMSLEEIRKNFLKEQTRKEIQETELEISKRTRKSIENEKRNDSDNDDAASLGNEFEKTLTKQADIPGVFAEKSDRKMNREFVGDNIDTNTIIDDVRKRTPKIKNDVSIDEGLDTFKRHSVKKNAKTHRTKGKIKDSDLGKRDQETNALGPEYQQYVLSKDNVQYMNKDGTINGVRIVDDETNEQNNYNVQYSNKINVDENENNFQTSNE